MLPAVLSYQSNPVLLKEDPKLLFSPGCWPPLCNYLLHDPGHPTNEGTL